MKIVTPWTPDEVQRAVTMRRIEGHPYAYIGRVLGRSKNSVIGMFWRRKVK